MATLWHYSTLHSSPCKLLEEQSLWGQEVCRIWLPNQDAVVRVPSSSLRPLKAAQSPELESLQLGYLAAAAKVAEVLEGSSSSAEGPVLLAPMEAKVIPLPHQLHALSRAISGDRVRYLLADEVGLGKTIEAGLILRELKLRGLVRRALVVAPKSLALQWVSEMHTHFGENFSLVSPGDLEALERLEPGAQLDDREEGDGNPWLRFPQAIVTLDAVKPLLRRKGWRKEKVAAYNRKRYDRLLQGRWDLIIVDESHRLGGSTEQVARFKLGQGLAEAAPYLLLLSATPHQGKSDAFQRLMSLLDPKLFADQDSLTRERVADFVIRTEKRKAVTAEGAPLFAPRKTQTLSVDLAASRAQTELYEAVTTYVKKGYNKALKERKPHIGFLMVLLQRIVTSSTQAIRSTLERRLVRLQALHEEAAELQEAEEQRDEVLEELSELDGQEQLDCLLEIDEPGRQGEIEEVRDLLALAERAQAQGPDVKTQALMDLILRLQGEENEPDLKLLIFTEFVPTQAMLQEFLEARGLTCALLNGAMNMDERRLAQRHFRESARVLISTDAGGEGLNLQFCHVVLNYDLPWNPMRIEQRIGRVDRIGQPHVVRALNFVHENSVESRVREVLESKLAIILEEMGIDKAGDVLSSPVSGERVEHLMAEIVLEGLDLEKAVDKAVSELSREWGQVRDTCAVYNLSEEPDIRSAQALRQHPLPQWVERMTVQYLQSHGGKAAKTLLGWDLCWPDGTRWKGTTFHRQEDPLAGMLLTLENARLRGLTLNLPRKVPGEALPCLHLPQLPPGTAGWWGLFELRLLLDPKAMRQVRLPSSRATHLALFVREDGKRFLPTGRHIWDLLLSQELKVLGHEEASVSAQAYDRLFSAATEAGLHAYEQLKSLHLTALSKEEERGDNAFQVRRRAIERLGLPEVRQHRLKILETEEAEWKVELTNLRQALPELKPLLMLKIMRDGPDEQ